MEIPFSHTYESAPTSSSEWIWEEKTTSPFNELIVSWNGLRPLKGKWTFWVSLRQDEWSPWMRYAEWSSTAQKTFKSEGGKIAQSFQDAVFPIQGFCDAFRIKAVAEGGSDLTRLDAIFACVSDLTKRTSEAAKKALPFAMLPEMPRQSQMVLDHPRATDLCSPTSTSTALNYLLKRPALDPVAFAAKVRDEEFDIYGNWILNTAQSYEEAKGKFKPHVERLNGFSDIHAYLCQKLPVVVSIRGPISGSPQPYASGHLVCVFGYDPNQSRVYCIDSGFFDNPSTFASYDLAEFLTAWGRRGNIAYVFPKKTEATL